VPGCPTHYPEHIIIDHAVPLQMSAGSVRDQIVADGVNFFLTFTGAAV
jgi:hypothetical protein